jgi:cysteine sulfinate desulfinase/cysteine desulfurase-like protein
MGTVRFSIGRTTTAEEIDHTIQVVAQSVRQEYLVRQAHRANQQSQVES